MEAVLEQAVNKQVNAELYSAYLYLAMSSWAKSEGWDGTANWMRIQAQEEQVHALTLHDQLLERNARSVMTAIEAPPAAWASLSDVFGEVLLHEQKVTAMINNLATIAMQQSDHAFYQFIQMFIKEQVEEEASATTILQRVKRLEGHPAMLDALDKELAARVFVQPFTNAAN